jgi:hypothetical protein
MKTKAEISAAEALFRRLYVRTTQGITSELTAPAAPD